MVTGAEIAARFKRYEHRVPYVWGRANPRGWDCSGAVNYVLCHDMGLRIPGFRGHTFTGRQHGPNTTMWFGFDGMRSIGRAQVRPGDIILWPTHMGIAVGPLSYISAYDTAEGTVIHKIHGGGPRGETATFHRHKGLDKGAQEGGGGGVGQGGSGQAWDDIQHSWRALRNTYGPWGKHSFHSFYRVQKRGERILKR